MGKHIQWFGYGIREAYGKSWTSGQVHWIEDEEQALDLLTQPGERFEEADPPTGEQGKDSPQPTDVEGAGSKRASRK